jgi:hypothetical protein
MRPYHFLELDLLERTKPASTGLHMQGSFDIVLFTLVFIWAVDERCECLAGYILKGLRATYVACIRIDQEQRFDFGNPSNDAPNSD